MPEEAEKDNLAEILQDTVTIGSAVKKLIESGYDRLEIKAINDGEVLEIKRPEDEFVIATTNGQTGIHPYGTMMMYIPQKAEDKPNSR